jgi:D-xylose transport system substrate-binding protein
MSVSRIRLLYVCVTLTIAASLLFGCGKKKDGEILIGLSLDTLAVERWHRDLEMFIERAEQLGAKVLYQSANGAGRESHHSWR